MEFLLTVAVFVLVVGLTFSGFLLLVGRRVQVDARLQAGGDSAAESTPELILGDLTPALAAQIPLGEENRATLQRDLRRAGFYRPTALMEFSALRTALVIVPLIAAGVLALLSSTVAQAVWIWMGGGIAAVLGFSLPRLYLHYRGRVRMHAIERGMPRALDMLTLCLGAGLNVLSSLQRVVKELFFSFPELAYELEIVRRQAELRTLEFGLGQFADRVGLPHARNLAVILSQSENLGTDAVAALREYADNIRFNMRQQAEEMANKAPFKLLFPAYLMAFGAGILLISPAVLEFTRFTNNNVINNSIFKARDILKESNPNGPGGSQEAPQP